MPPDRQPVAQEKKRPQALFLMWVLAEQAGFEPAVGY